MKLTRRSLAAALPLLMATRPAFAQTANMQLTTTASNDYDVEWLEELKKNVEAGSQGKIRANVYPGSQLGSGPTTVEGVALGTIEVAMNASGTYEAVEPRAAILSVPGLYDTIAQGQTLLTSPEVRTQLDKLGRDKGFQVLTALVQSPAAIVTKRPVRTLVDMNGMKIRVPGSASVIEQLKGLGAAPIAMSLGEVLPAFQNGTIDGVYAGTTIFTSLKYYDISKNMTLVPRTFLVMLGIINSDFLTTIGPLARVVLDASHKADVDSQAWGAQDVANAEKLWEANGGQTFTLGEADAKKYLDVVVPIAVKQLSPAGRADYEVLKTAAAKMVQ